MLDLQLFSGLTAQDMAFSCPLRFTEGMSTAMLAVYITFIVIATMTKRMLLELGCAAQDTLSPCTHTGGGCTIHRFHPAADAAASAHWEGGNPHVPQTPAGHRTTCSIWGVKLLKALRYANMKASFLLPPSPWGWWCSEVPQFGLAHLSSQCETPQVQFISPTWIQLHARYHQGPL